MTYEQPKDQTDCIWLKCSGNLRKDAALAIKVVFHPAVERVERTVCNLRDCSKEEWGCRRRTLHAHRMKQNWKSGSVSMCWRLLNSWQCFSRMSTAAKKKRHIRLWAQVCTGVLISSIFSILLDSLPRGKLACMWGIGMHWYVLDYAVCLFFWKKTIVWSIQWSKKWGSGTSLCKQVSAMWAWSRQRTSISCSGRWMFLTKSTKTQIVKLFYNYLQCTILQTKDLSDRSRILPKKLVDPVFLSPRPLRHWRHLKTRPELTLWSISANVSQLSPPRKFWESWPAMECVKLKCFILRNSILSWFYPRTKLCIHSCA